MWAQIYVPCIIERSFAQKVVRKEGAEKIKIKIP